MTERTDKWAAGDAYEAYMGRWSRPLGRAFLDWLHPKASTRWLEIGCGTGSLTSAICETCRPASVLACDPSEPFIESARRNLSDDRVSFAVAGAEALPARDGGFDAIVSALVLNFIPEPERALAAMSARAAPGGVIAACVWDYAGGVEFLGCFWEEAVALDPSAAALDESRRFGSWQQAKLSSLFQAAGLTRVEAGTIEIPTNFSNFDEYWQPFLGGTGPAPSYVASLDEAQRALLKDRLERRFQPGSDGLIRLRARASVVRGFSNG